MISTRDLDALPDNPSLRRLTRSLAMLDAILSPDWDGRYYFVRFALDAISAIYHHEPLTDADRAGA